MILRVFSAVLTLLLSRVCCLGVRFPAPSSFEPDSDLLYTTTLHQAVAISRMIDASMKQRWVRTTPCTLHFREESNFASQLSPLVMGKPYLALQRETVGGRLYGGENAVRLCSACECSGCCARHPALCTNRNANMMY